MTQRACSLLKIFSSSTASLQSSTACASASCLNPAAVEICLAAVVPMLVVAVAVMAVAVAPIFSPLRVGALIPTMFVLRSLLSGPPPLR